MIHGIINIYKEKGFTSFDVVAKLRGIFHQKKIGHTGTLDPDAEGVLPVCLGRATKVCELLTDKDKVYETVLLLGIDTDTQDASGKVLYKAPESLNIRREEVLETIGSFVGEYDQIPPMYSALKVNGQKLCDLARKGIEVERKARKVEIYSIDILKTDLPRVRMRVHCSKGTYIRTLCHDIGEKLGCGGCMEELVRTRVASFEQKDALRLSEIERLVKTNEILPYILSVDCLFENCDAMEASGSEDVEKRIQNGNRIPEKYVHRLREDPLKKKGKAMHTNADPDRVRLYDGQGRFIGIYSYIEEQKDYKPVKIFLETI